MIKKKKYIFLIILFIFLVIFMQNISYAKPFDGQGGGTGGAKSGSGLDLGSLDDYKGTGTSSKKFEDKIGVIFGALRIVGTVLSVIILIVIGLKYMLGSAEEKADYKKTLIPYIWGTFFIFATSVLPQIIYEFIKGIGWI